jgi:protein dithiol oxidoreductase (disulfide-forming)
MKKNVVLRASDLARNNFPICSASGGRAAALPLACVVPLYGASGRLASHPARLVQIGKLFLARSLSALFLATALLTAQAAPVAGKDYIPINPPQPVETGDKIEVLEAFSYYCPHCYQFEPLLNTWMKTLPADVAVRKLPVTFNRDSWVNLAKVYYTLEITGDLPKLNTKVFEALHGQKLNLGKPEVLFDWVAKQGVDQKKFADNYNSFSVQTKVARIPQLTQAYGVDSVPNVIVDGKYRVLTHGSYDEMFRVINELIALARSQRPAKTATTESPAAAVSTKKAIAK